MSMLPPRVKYAFLALTTIFTFFCSGSNGQANQTLSEKTANQLAPPSSTLDPDAQESHFKALGPKRPELRRGNAYAITLAEEALPDEQLPAMVSGHPRLLIRPESWEYGLSVGQLRARAQKEPWATQVARDMKKPPDHPSSSSVITHRALLYLITQDESLVPRIVERILAAKPRYNTGGGLVSTALWYDWIYNSKSITDIQRQQMADKIAETALKCAEIYESGHAFDIWTHRASPGWLADVLAAGLVLDDAHPAARKLRGWAMGFFKRNYFRAWQHNDGAWMHGGASYNIGMIMPKIIAYWASAVTGEDIYQVIKQDYGNWLEGHLHYMMSEVLPDKTRSDAVAWDYAPKKLRIKGRSYYWPIARAYRNSEFYAFQRWLGEDPKSGHYGRLIRILFYDPKVDAQEPEFELSGPFVKLWGRYGPGYMQMRSKGWAPDSTVIEFKSGDWVWTHTHANNNNSFWIYHKGRLAVQGGSYGLDQTWHGGTGSHYFTQSISSNTMLIFQPGEFNHPGGRGAGDLEPPGVIANPGGQRFRWACGQTCFTFDEYLRRKTEESNIESGLFETGDIIAYEQAADASYAYVSADATMAYNNPRYTYSYRNRKTGQTRHNKPKIDLFTRSLVYLMGTDNLLVFDRVQALDASWRKAWLSHFQGKPEIVDGDLMSAEVPGHIEEFSGGTVRMTWSDGVLKPPDPNDPGRLFIKTFLPRKHTIRRIGGDGYQAWWNGKNRTGDDKPILLDRIDAGRWRIEISPIEPKKFNVFLNLIHIGDKQTETLPKAELIRAASDNMVGLKVADRLVLFGRLGTVSEEVTYPAPAGSIEHLIVDLPPEQTYQLSDGQGLAKQLTTSPEGTVRFATHNAGELKLTPQP